MSWRRPIDIPCYNHSFCLLCCPSVCLSVALFVFRPGTDLALHLNNRYILQAGSWFTLRLPPPLPNHDHDTDDKAKAATSDNDGGAGGGGDGGGESSSRSSSTECAQEEEEEEEWQELLKEQGLYIRRPL